MQISSASYEPYSENSAKIDSIKISDKNIVEKNFNQFQKILAESTSKFISELYYNILIPRNIIQNIINYTENFLRSGILVLVQQSMGLLINQSSYADADLGKIINTMLDQIISCFQNVNTESKRLKFFENSHCLIKPQKIKIGESTDVSKSNGNVSLVVKERLVNYIFVGKTLTYFLELPNVLTEILQYQDFLSREGNKKNIKQRVKWFTMVFIKAKI